MRAWLLLPLVLAAGCAAADEGQLSCQPLSQVSCTLGEGCTQGAATPIDVSFWPDWTPVDLCRASHCPPMGPSIAVCGLEICGSGTVKYAWEGGAQLGQLRKGMAYVGPDPAPRLYATTFYALAFEPESGTLALSRFDPEGVRTTWFACAPASED